MLIFASILAFYLAWNLGANDVANSMGTSVGSKAVTLKQALVIAGILEFSGAILFGRNVSARLASGVVNPHLFTASPQIFLVGMVAVLLSCGVWINIATMFGLPVSSSHAVVGAIAGFGWVAMGGGAVNWVALGTISLTWVLTPIMTGAIAWAFYALIRRWILDVPNPLTQLNEWIPWLSVALFGVFGIIVLPAISQPLHRLLLNRWELTVPAQDISLGMGAIATVGLTLQMWRQLAQELPDADLSHPQVRAGSFSSPVEFLLARFQILSACFVAFAHGSNDVGNAIAPLAAISFLLSTGAVPRDEVPIPVWILALGGVGIVAGLAVWGRRVIATIGEGIIALQPSGGFCAELATATTVLLASQFGLPVSTSHALVGGVVGVGLAQRQGSIQLQTLRNIGLAWLVTIPVAVGLGAGVFKLANLLLMNSMLIPGGR